MKNNLVFLTELRFYSDEFNDIYFDKDFDINIWDNYLFYYEKITVLARVKKTTKAMLIGYMKNNNDRVNFVSLPYYVGLKELIFKRRTLIKRIKYTLEEHRDSPVILRVPGVIGFYAANFLKKRGALYGIEVVGDPCEVFSGENFDHPLRLILQKTAVKQLKYTIKHASSIVYVTNSDLQKKYPPRSNSEKFAISNVRIADNFIASNPKMHYEKQEYNILCIGSLAQMYKGADVMLEALSYINTKNPDFNIKLIWLGDGVHKAEMQLLAKSLSIETMVSFLGNVNTETVLDKMNSSDLLVHPSRTEGLPRVIIEAMSRGLPVVATNVGGIPELLEEKAMVNKNNSKELALKIIEVLSSSDLYNQQADRNLKFSVFFRQDNLNDKRQLFFNSLK
ncbi:glycosyltransferase [Psychrobacter sp. W2-37-MNA-CIBAN-0211]|jgi:glycosyltransferase involved in cell wall biosynthesis|uniref:glycosyltransferase n=1 Tax=Psychrobacter sp. W2-37-MNA-CIBAN-0211 TaxID=3140443 RepID=UPI0033211B2A